MSEHRLTSALAGKIALVTGGSRGVGRGIARGLAEAGATVYVTGRTSQRGPDTVPGTVEHVAREVDALGGRGIPVRCDHGDDVAVAALFARIEAESGRLDVLVNNVHSGIDEMADVVHQRFWQIDPGCWDRMNGVGLRGHYIASVHGARLMVPRKSGLIVNVSSIGAIAYLFNVAYGVGKAALDRMTADMAAELRSEGVTVISLWPGLVRTELTSALMTDAIPAYRRLFEACSETPLLAGRVVAALAADPRVNARSGGAVIAAEVARRYGVSDENGTRPRSARSFRTLATGLLPAGWQRWAALVPPGNAPLWLVGPVLRRFCEGIKNRGGYRQTVSPSGTGHGS